MTVYQAPKQPDCPDCGQRHHPLTVCAADVSREAASWLRNLPDASGEFTGYHDTAPGLEECPCAGLGWLGAEWLFARPPVCTCGAGDPNDYTVMHEISCDAVPCPFCPLEAEK